MLYGEDEDSVAAGATAILELHGHDVVHVRSAAEADTVADDDVFDVLLTDLDLGNGPDGLQVIRNVRYRCLGLPVTILSGREHVLTDGLPPGPLVVMRKPTSPDDLLGALDAVVSERALLAEGLA